MVNLTSAKNIQFLKMQNIMSAKLNGFTVIYGAHSQRVEQCLIHSKGLLYSGYVQRLLLAHPADCTVDLTL